MPQVGYQLSLTIQDQVYDYGDKRPWYSWKTNEELTKDWSPAKIETLRARVLFYDQQSGFMRFLRRFFSGAGMERLRAQLVYWESKQFLDAYLETKEISDSMRVLSEFGKPVAVLVSPHQEPKNWVLEEQIKKLSFWSSLRNPIRQFYKTIHELFQKKNTGDAMIPRAEPTVLAAEAQSIAEAHYRVLGVKSTANLTAIKRAYKSLSLQYHPDKDGPKEEFQRLVEAYCFAIKHAKPEIDPAANEVIPADEFERDLIARGYSREAARKARLYHDETMAIISEAREMTSEVREMTRETVLSMTNAANAMCARVETMQAKFSEDTAVLKQELTKLKQEFEARQAGVPLVVAAASQSLVGQLPCSADADAVVEGAEAPSSLKVGGP